MNHRNLTTEDETAVYYRPWLKNINMCMQAPAYCKSPTVRSHNAYIPHFPRPCLLSLKNQRPEGAVVTYRIFLNFVNMDWVKQVTSVK